MTQMKAPHYQRAPIIPIEAAELLVYCLSDVFEAPHATEEPAAVAAEPQPGPSSSLVPVILPSAQLSSLPIFAAPLSYLVLLHPRQELALLVQGDLPLLLVLQSNKHSPACEHRQGTPMYRQAAASLGQVEPDSLLGCRCLQQRPACPAAGDVCSDAQCARH